MMLIDRSIATLELLLVAPATLFMTALFLRNVQPPPYQPAETARRIVDWYAARPHVGLHIFLIALPFFALVIGVAMTLRTWRNDARLRDVAIETVATLRSYASFLLIAAATLLAGSILAIVALHVLTD
jgi:cytochrome b561